MALNIIEHIQKKLLELPVSYLKSQGSQVLVRCPFCEDSIKNPHHAHFYIGFLDNGVIVYDCKRCPTSGKLTKEVMHMMNIYDENIDKYLDSKQKMGITKKISYDNTLYTDWKIPPNIDEKDLKKVRYFETRTGIKVTKQTVQDYKIILNLNDFLSYNNIDLISNIMNKKEKAYQIELLRDLSDSFIGVLTYNKNTINMRNIDSKLTKKRYYNFTINKNIKSTSLYIPTSIIDVLALNPKIILAEGFFDIICVKNKFFPDKTSQNLLFCATGSKGSYVKALTQLMKITGFIDAKVLIFSDKDVDIEEYRTKIFPVYRDMVKMDIYYNNPYKDFGHIEHLIFDEEKYPDHKIIKYKLIN